MEGLIRREPARAAERSYDLLVIGGGVYGVALCLEAARRGLAPLLLERGDFGSATSWNSLRIVHGGLRYLQTLDLLRFRESVAERSWFLRHFPEQVRPLRCLMPLYGRGAKRPSVFRVALAINALLSAGRNRDVRSDRQLAAGELLDPEQTRREFPAVATEGLRGAAVWYDAVMPSSQRLLIEMLRWACAAGARALNYVEATELLTDRGRVTGVRARDLETGAAHDFGAGLVVNSAGPWCRSLGAELDRDVPRLFRPSVAFNVLLDRAPLSEGAVAVAPRRGAGQTYFLHALGDRLFAGTRHAPWPRGVGGGPPDEALVDAFLGELNDAVPGLAVGAKDVLRLHWGLLPARADGSAELAVRDVLHDHGVHGGPRGLYSVSGVKFTTARHVAQKNLTAVLRARGESLPALADVPRPTPRNVPSLAEVRRRRAEAPDALADELASLVGEEAVVRPDDLALRRSDWGLDPRETEAATEAATAVLGSAQPQRLGAGGGRLRR